MLGFFNSSELRWNFLSLWKTLFVCSYNSKYLIFSKKTSAFPQNRLFLYFKRSSWNHYNPQTPLLTTLSWIVVSLGFAVPFWHFRKYLLCSSYFLLKNLSLDTNLGFFLFSSWEKTSSINMFTSCVQCQIWLHRVIVIIHGNKSSTHQDWQHTCTHTHTPTRALRCQHDEARCNYLFDVSRFVQMGQCWKWSSKWSRDETRWEMEEMWWRGKKTCQYILSVVVKGRNKLVGGRRFKKERKNV